MPGDRYTSGIPPTAIASRLLDSMFVKPFRNKAMRETLAGTPYYNTFVLEDDARAARLAALTGGLTGLLGEAIPALGVGTRLSQMARSTRALRGIDQMRASRPQAMASSTGRYVPTSADDAALAEEIYRTIGAYRNRRGELDVPTTATRFRSVHEILEHYSGDPVIDDYNRRFRAGDLTQRRAVIEEAVRDPRVSGAVVHELRPYAIARSQPTGRQEAEAARSIVRPFSRTEGPRSYKEFEQDIDKIIRESEQRRKK